MHFDGSVCCRTRAFRMGKCKDSSIWSAELLYIYRVVHLDGSMSHRVCSGHRPLLVTINSINLRHTS
jgi:hypothetical protein